MPTIISAIYASINQGIDVTAAVSSIIASGNDDVPANNTSFGDPDPGSVKYFMVWYTAGSLNNGNPVALACREGGTIDLVPVAPPPYQYSTQPQPGVPASAISAVTVEQAVYGTPNNGFDVTAICQAMFNQGSLANGQPGPYSVPLANSTFGGDPDVGTKKAFAMRYRVDGAGPFYIGGLEGQTLTLPATPQSAPEIIATVPPAPAT